MPDYSKCVIYKLCCKNLDVKEIYVGSTCNFTRRKNAHKTDSNNLNCKKYNLKVYKFIRDNSGIENWDMILIEEYPCENKMQKVKRERYWCEELKSELNSMCPGRSNKESVQEYQKKNKDKINAQRKIYVENNKEKVKEQVKQSNRRKYLKCKEQYHKKNKEYYEANKEKILQQQKEYKLRHKNELLLKDKE